MTREQAVEKYLEVIKQQYDLGNERALLGADMQAVQMQLSYAQPHERFKLLKAHQELKEKSTSLRKKLRDLEVESLQLKLKYGIYQTATATPSEPTFNDAERAHLKLLVNRARDTDLRVVARLQAALELINIVSKVIR